MRSCALALAIIGCGPASDAAPLTPFERTVRACKAKVHATGGRPVLSTHDEPWADYDHDLTIRVLSPQPFLFQTADPGTRKHALWYQLAISPAEVDATLAALPFGAVVRAHYTAPPIQNSTPPPELTALPGLPPAAEPAVIAEWYPDRTEGQIQLYADGHALITAPPHPLIDLALTQPEIDDVLDSFARARFDTLATGPSEHDRRSGRAILLCDRYQQADVTNHADDLAPIAAAFARLRDKAITRARPVLRVTDRGWRPHIFTWPADAPPLVDDWYSARFDAAKRAAARDGSHPMYHKLPDDLAAAAAQRDHRAIVFDHGTWWGVTVETCDTCRPGTYASLNLEKESWQEAPAWAPDFAKIDDAGLWLDGRDPRLKTLAREYLQHGALYDVWQTEAVPPAKR